jgi:hypothetical protein
VLVTFICWIGDVRKLGWGSIFTTCDHMIRDPSLHCMHPVVVEHIALIVCYLLTFKTLDTYTTCDHMIRDPSLHCMHSVVVEHIALIVCYLLTFKTLDTYPTCAHMIRDPSLHCMHFVVFYCGTRCSG